MSSVHGQSNVDQVPSKIKSRKRTRNIERSKIHQQKFKVQRGLEHITKSGKLVEAKVFCEQTSCNCKKNCAKNIDIDRQKELHTAFYSLENWSKKTLFLRSLIKSRPTKENLNPVITKQKVFYDYFLTNSRGNQESVCHAFFLKCFQVPKDRVYRIMRTAISNGAAIDNRGKKLTPKTRKRDLNFLKKFINKFPRYYSHYGTSKSDKKYLNPNLNIIRLYREYCIVCNFEKRKTLSEWKFRHIFDTQFNLSFHPKKVDSCRTCDKLHALVQSETTNSKTKEHLLKQKQYHLQMVKRSDEVLKKTIQDAQEPSSKTEVLVFDLQRALELPSISTSEAFYKRQLWCYNLCVYDEKRKRGYMYFWNESIASRGSQEVSSCLKKHFELFVPTDTEKVILYSDACGGQNRSIKTTLMVKKLLNSWPHSELTSIEQRFFISGHSYNSCDRCFGVIERQKRITEIIYTPEHWIHIIEQAKKEEPKFQVIKMNGSDFFSCKQLESIITNRKTSLTKDKVEWLKIRKIVNHRSKPFNITVYGDEMKDSIEVSLRKKGKKNNSLTFENASFEPLYTENRKIAQKKYMDLQKLLEFVPSQFHSFYATLKCEEGEEEV